MAGLLIKLLVIENAEVHTENQRTRVADKGLRLVDQYRLWYLWSSL
jgi:hypothetical protein